MFKMFGCRFCAVRNIRHTRRMHLWYLSGCASTSSVDYGYGKRTTARDTRTHTHILRCRVRVHEHMCHLAVGFGHGEHDTNVTLSKSNVWTSSREYDHHCDHDTPCPTYNNGSIFASIFTWHATVFIAHNVMAVCAHALPMSWAFQ